MWRSMQTAMSPPTNSNLDERGTRGSAVFSLCRHATEVRNIRPNKAMPARFANGSSSLNEEPWRRLRQFFALEPPCQTRPRYWPSWGHCQGGQFAASIGGRNA